MVCLRKHLPADVQPLEPSGLLTRYPTFKLQGAAGAQAWLKSVGVNRNIASHLDETNDPPRRISH